MDQSTDTNIKVYENTEDMSKDFGKALENKSLGNIAKLITNTKFKINGQEYYHFEDLPQNIQEAITKNNFKVLQPQFPTVSQAKIISPADAKRMISGVNTALKVVTYITSFGANYSISHINFSGGNHIPLPASIISSFAVGWLANKLNDRRQKQIANNPQLAEAISLTDAIGFDTKILTKFSSIPYSIFLNLLVIFIEGWIFRQITLPF